MPVEIADIGGGFNYLDIASKKPLFLSGGSGVTPVMSMLQYITDVTEPTDVVFVHFARSPKDIIFGDQLHFMNKRFRNVTVHLVVGDLDGETGFAGRVGRIDAELMRDLVPDMAEREIFMCGPEGFMRAAREMVRNAPVAALHEESFGERITIEESGELGGEVYFALAGRQGTCAPGETLLEAALNAGIWIDSACQQGICGNCKVVMTKGTVDMDDLGGLSDAEKAQGFVLTCCARPRGAVSLDA